MQCNFDGFLVEDEKTGYKLVSAQLNLQPKKNVNVAVFKFIVSNISCYFFNMMTAASLKDTLRQLCV